MWMREAGTGLRERGTRAPGVVLLGTVGTSPALTLAGVLEAGLFQTQAKVLRLCRLIGPWMRKRQLPSLADMCLSVDPCP
jgi:hypothetical protein